MANTGRLRALRNKYEVRAGTWNTRIERTFRNTLYPWFDGHLHKTLQDHTSSRKVESYALDLGCGTGKSTENLFPYAENIVAVDLSKEMLKKAQKRFRKIDPEKRPELILCSATNLPFVSNSIYVVSARGSLINHLGKDNTGKMLKELYNSMMKESIFVFNFAEKTSSIDEIPNGPFTFYEIDEVERMLNDVGFLYSILGNKRFKVRSNKHYFENNSVCIKAEKYPN